MSTGCVDAGRLLATAKDARASWGQAHGHVECESLRNLSRGRRGVRRKRLGAQRDSYDQVPMHNPDDQRGVIMKSMDIIEKFWGKRPAGWFGPGLTQTYETLDYLAEAGVEYIGDWVLDDEPVTLKTTHGSVVALPYNFELHDIVMMALQHHPSDMMYRRALDHFTCLYEESAE